MIWTLLSAVAFARFFYVWGFNSGQKDHERRAERYLARMETDSVLRDEKPFHFKRRDIRRIK